jgi:hypothetical protein
MQPLSIGIDVYTAIKSHLWVMYQRTGSFYIHNQKHGFVSVLPQKSKASRLQLNWR